MLQDFNRERLIEDLSPILEEVCEVANFNYAEILLPDSGGLQPSPHYYVFDDINGYYLEVFYQCSQGSIISGGTLLDVLATGQSKWMLNIPVEFEDGSLRDKDVEVCGLETGIAIPIIRDEVLLIMAFYKVESVCYLPRYSESIIDAIAGEEHQIIRDTPEIKEIVGNGFKITINKGKDNSEINNFNIQII